MSYKYKDENGIIHDIADNYEVQEPGYEVYSAIETVCGEWLGKPLYRKVIPITIQASGTTTQIVNHGIENIKEVISITGSFINSAGTAVNPIPQFIVNGSGAVTNYVRVFSNSLTQITIEMTGSTYAGRRGYLVLAYTKTID